MWLRSFFLSVVCVTVIGCGGTSASHSAGPALGKYPAANEQAFLGSCEREASASAPQDKAKRYCRTALACIENRMSARQFDQVDRNLMLGRANPGQRTVLACVKAARRTVGR